MTETTSEQEPMPSAPPAKGGKGKIIAVVLVIVLLIAGLAVVGVGFDLVGVTTPDPPQHLDTYRRWLEAGRHGSMAYLAAERAVARRADPRP